MTEQEWLECGDPQKMLHFLRGSASDRKLRLFGVASCRRVEHCLPDRRSSYCIVANERYADGLVDEHQLEAAWQMADQVLGARQAHRTSVAQRDAALAVARLDLALHASGNVSSVARLAASSAGAWARGANRESNRLTPDLSRAAEHCAEEAAFQAAQMREQLAQTRHLRCIFGNPFRPLTIQPPWRTPTVTSLAQAIYADRAFDRMPVLGDALEDAGCTHADVLQHCRQPGEHVRGCWLVDALIGKE